MRSLFSGMRVMEICFGSSVEIRSLNHYFKKECGVAVRNCGHLSACRLIQNRRHSRRFNKALRDPAGVTARHPCDASAASGRGLLIWQLDEECVRHVCLVCNTLSVLCSIRIWESLAPLIYTR